MKDIKTLNMKEMEKVNGGADTEAVAMIDDIDELEALGIEVDPDAVALPASSEGNQLTTEQFRRMLLRRNSDSRVRRATRTVTRRALRPRLF